MKCWSNCTSEGLLKNFPIPPDVIDELEGFGDSKWKDVFFPDWRIVGLFIIQEMMAMGRLYWWYKAHNICTQCRKEEAVPGRTLCPECAEKSRARAAERRAAKRDEINREQKERNKRMKEKGLCRCGRPARPGKVQCLECALRDNRRTLARRHSSGRTLPHGLRQELRICRRCSKPAVPGYYFCEEHLAKQREYMAKAISAGMNDSNVIAARKWMRRTMM